MKNIAALLFLFVASSPAMAEVAERHFEDQQQFELFYEFCYRANVVESFLLECTGKRSVSWKFGYATAPISNSYRREILGVGGLVPDVFTNKPLSKRLWDETSLAVMRNHETNDDYSDPVLMAQKDVLRLMEVFQSEKNVLCDYIFWEDVLKLEDVTSELIRDAKVRKKGMSELQRFEDNIQPGLAVMNRLFKANPLRRHQ